KVLDESILAISNEAEHMNHLVEQLLFLARGDSGKTVLQKENIVLNELMKEIYEESFLIDEEHPYRFRDVEEIINIEADRALLKQAVRILVDNAAKYTEKNDEIILGVGRTDDDRPYLMVQDTGIGMSQTDVEHMFERFYRADEARSYQGTGLGLSIAKWIVDRHGGHFEILSRTELGTRILIVLP
ncbi:MAG: HAMP domain-containing histidine kinase, partial [Butyrivibrio sp.]|nr:HAMP domain-containing histidine kinase [Butyrivibrio sp.]